LITAEKIKNRKLQLPISVLKQIENLKNNHLSNLKEFNAVTVKKALILKRLNIT